MIASPLEPELVERVRDATAVREVLYDASLLPAPRYPNDHRGDDVVRDAPSERRWDEMLARANVLFGYPLETGAGLKAALQLGPHVGFVQGTSAGMGAHIRRAHLTAETLARVRFASAAGVHAQMLAEFVFYGLLALRKDAARLARMRAERSWTHYAMGELEGSTLAVVGMGQIGKAVTQLARAFAMRVVVVARHTNYQPLAERAYPPERLHDALRLADAVVVTLPATERTEGLLDAEALAVLKPSAVFVNVGRGSVVDQDALVAMLAGDRLAGAVLDVFAEEPLPPEHPLWTMENVILSPHTAALSFSENRRIVDLFCDNLARYAAQRPLRNAVNLEEFY